MRWPERADLGETAVTAASTPLRSSEDGAAPTNGALRLGTYRPIWAAPEVEISPVLQYTIAHQQVELSPEDAQRLGVTHGDAVDVAQNGTRLRATAAVRSGVPPGAAFLADGIADDSANALTEPLIEVIKP